MHSLVWYVSCVAYISCCRYLGVVYILVPWCIQLMHYLVWYVSWCGMYLGVVYILVCTLGYFRVYCGMSWYETSLIGILWYG